MTIEEPWRLYDRFATAFDRARSRNSGEERYLRDVLARLGGQRSVLDLGCGAGEPVAQFFIAHGCAVTGADAAASMVALAEARFPRMTWLHRDMRALDLGRRFDAIIAWDSFFHLAADAQRAMFAVFAAHAAPGAVLLFNSGPAAGEVIGRFEGHELFHASLGSEEYAALLSNNGFDVLLHVPEDPECGGRTVWLAERRSQEGKSA